jgi:hypothetical protein
MKKVLALAIAFMVIGLTVVQAQDRAKLDALERELDQLEAKVDRGQQLTPRDVQRMQEIQQEIIQAMGPYGNMFQFQPQGNTNTNDGDRQVQQLQQMQQQTLQQQQNIQPQQQQRNNFPSGDTSGWPTASIFSQCNLPNLRQPAGTTVSYNYNSQNRGLSIYIINGTRNTANELSRAIEADGKATYKDVPGGYFVLPAPSGLNISRDGHYQASVLVEDGYVEIRVFVAEG